MLSSVVFEAVKNNPGRFPDGYALVLIKGKRKVNWSKNSTGSKNSSTQ